MLSTIISMTLFALIGGISPGPVNIISTGAGANFGFKGALPFVLGATVSYTLVVFLVGIGLNTTIETFPQITRSLQAIGSAFLLYMSYKIATAATVESSSSDRNSTSTSKQKPPSFIEGVLAQGLNPKAWLVSMSGVSLFVSANSPAYLYLLIFCAISFIICFIGVGTWALMGQLISTFLSTKKQQRRFNIIMGLLLASTVIFIMTAKL